MDSPAFCAASAMALCSSSVTRQWITLVFFGMETPLETKYLPAGTILFATRDCKGGRVDARQWLRGSGLTPEQVRLYSDEGMVMVAALTKLEWSKQ
jgi:hypothetical protein